LYQPHEVHAAVLEEPPVLDRGHRLHHHLGEPNLFLVNV
jgi:hypothetical protein